MGKRGPASTPTALKLVKGERKDRINFDEPKPDAAAIRPEWLAGEAVEVWDELAPRLTRLPILTAWDVDTFAALCAAIVENRHAFADLERNGNRITVPVRELADGTVIYATSKNPAWQVARESAQLIVTLGGRFGLNPSDRQNLKVGDGRDKPAGADLLTS